jgi:hypothetical protein
MITADEKLARERKFMLIFNATLELLSDHWRNEPHHHHLCHLCKKVKTAIGREAFEFAEIQSLAELHAGLPPSGDAA